MAAAAAEIFKKQVQIAIQKSITSDQDYTTLMGDMVSWYRKARKHLFYHEDEGELDPILTSAILTHEIANWQTRLPVYDPLMLLDRFSTMTPELDSVVYIYDLNQLGSMPEIDVVRFFSYMKYALMNDMRFIMAVNTGYDIPSFDYYFKDKKVANKVMYELIGGTYCHKVGL